MDIQQLLLEKALRDAQSGPTMAETAGGGAALLGTAGLLAGMYGGAPKSSSALARIPKPLTSLPLGEIGGELRQRAQSLRGRAGLAMGQAGRNGRRMAVGSLVGALVGGGLGAGAKQTFLSGMPNQAANFLAKIQTTPEGQLTEADQLQLRAILRDIYSGR